MCSLILSPFDRKVVFRTFNVMLGDEFDNMSLFYFISKIGGGSGGGGGSHVIVVNNIDDDGGGSG